MTAQRIIGTLIVGFLMLLALASVGFSQCESPKSVVRIDDHSKRLFIVQAQPGTLSSAKKARALLAPINDFVAQCKPTWNHEWVVSVFSKKDFAGYKDEPSIQPYIDNGQWGAGYLAEYDRRTQTLTLRPLDAKRLKKLRISF